MRERSVKVSKYLSYLLRHSAAKDNLDRDPHGFFNIDDILTILSQKFEGLTKAELLEIVQSDPKWRYELNEGRIRARYGHSIEIEPLGKPVEPPEILYHGTARKYLGAIMKQGLRPMNRKFVHLSPDLDMATLVGKRHSQDVVILRVHAKRAHDIGISFYHEETVYLAEPIPPEYVEPIDH
jgi:putative RNA 2'-phosphotransferase